MSDKFNANVHFTKNNNFLTQFMTSLGDMGKKGTEFIIRQHNGLNM